MRFLFKYLLLPIKIRDEHIDTQPRVEAARGELEAGRRRHWEEEDSAEINQSYGDQFHENWVLPYVQE